MLYLQFFCRYWIIIALSGAFYSGYYLRGLQYDASEKIAFVATLNKDTKVSGKFEESQAEINKLYDNIQTGLTYANSYTCIIPVDGLQLLKQATR